MWPRAEAHGNNRPAGSPTTRLPGFNVAAGRSPRKYPYRPHQRRRRSALQCGRGPKPTEMNRSTASRSRGQQLQCGRGPKPTEINNPTPFSLLNMASMWPRAEAHGNPTPVSMAIAPMSLQCGRGPKPTEIPDSRGAVGQLSVASMWPRAEAHGNIPTPHNLIDLGDASMWPRAEAHGNAIPP